MGDTPEVTGFGEQGALYYRALQDRSGDIADFPNTWKQA